MNDSVLKEISSLILVFLLFMNEEHMWYNLCIN